MQRFVLARDAVDRVEHCGVQDRIGASRHGGPALIGRGRRHDQRAFERRIPLSDGIGGRVVCGDAQQKHSSHGVAEEGETKRGHFHGGSFSAQWRKGWMLTERTMAVDSAVRQRDHVGLITQFSRERDHRLGGGGRSGRPPADIMNSRDKPLLPLTGSTPKTKGIETRAAAGCPPLSAARNFHWRAAASVGSTSSGSSRNSFMGAAKRFEGGKIT